jgi:hypothetical protein
MRLPRYYQTIKTRLPVVLVTIAVAISGYAVITATSAATFVASTEAEGGALGTTAAIVSDPAASGGNAVRFGSGTAAATPGLPFALPAKATLRAASQKVFAHYFTLFPISIDNLDPASDYYTAQFLNPTGENGTHTATGGFLRDRPLPRAPLSGNWQLQDMKTEVTRASDAGLDGFTVDVLSLSGYHMDRLKVLLQAAQEVDPSFKIVLMPDATTVADDANTLAANMANLAKTYTSVYRLGDGRVVISPFFAEQKGLTYWTQFISAMQGQGLSVAFVPCFLNYGANAAAYAPISYGFSNWGDRSPASNSSLAGNITDAHNRGKIWMQPVSVQDERPSQGIYDEANNTENLRITWNAALGGADWVQIPTWNDYSESAEVAPSANTGWSFLDLISYYLTRYKTGTFPAITKDTAYITSRIHFVNSTPTYNQTKLMSLRGGSSPPRDNVEILTMLTQPATVQVMVGTQAYSYDAPAGMSTKLFPLGVGNTNLKIVRNGAVTTQVAMPFNATNAPYVQDLQYHAVSSGR